MSSAFPYLETPARQHTFVSRGEAWTHGSHIYTIDQVTYRAPWSLETGDGQVATSFHSSLVEQMLPKWQDLICALGGSVFHSTLSNYIQFDDASSEGVKHDSL